MGNIIQSCYFSKRNYFLTGLSNISFKCSISVHLGAGFWAAIASPLFRQTGGIIFDVSKYNLQMFGWHLLAAVAIFVWSGLTVFLVLIFFVFARSIKYSGREGMFFVQYCISFRIQNEFLPIR